MLQSGFVSFKDYLKVNFDSTIYLIDIPLIENIVVTH